jgi:outer membrane protein X
MAVGANVVFTPGWVDGARAAGDPKSNNGGFGAKLQYNVTAPIRVEGAFAFLPSGDGLGMWDLSVNAHYLIPVMKKINVYPIAGLDFMVYTPDWEAVDLRDGALIILTENAEKYKLFGINIGGGAEYKLSRKVSLQGELKYIIGFDSTIFSNALNSVYFIDYFKTNRLMISIGAVYKF